MPDVSQQPMQTLNAQWYNAIVTGLGLQASTFQLVQSSDPLGSTSEDLWKYFDSLPPASATNFFNPAQFTSFAQIYGAVVGSLASSNTDALRQLLGDDYGKWVTYRQANPPTGTQTPLSVFSTWAYKTLDNATQAIATYQQLSLTIPAIASRMFAAATPLPDPLNPNPPAPVYAYGVTIAQMKAALLRAPSKTAQMDSGTTSADLSQTWAAGSVGGEYGLFSGSASGDYSRLAQQFASSQVTVQASFTSQMQLAAGPLAQSSMDPDLMDYKPWYYYPALSLAYHSSDNRTWQAGAGATWENTFGPSGSLQRVCTGLIIVDGIDLTVTSRASFSQDDQAAFQAAAKAGFWPFATLAASGGSTQDVSFGSDGSVTVHMSMPAGNPQVLGVVVTPISALIANQGAAQNAAVLAAPLVPAG